LFYARKIVISQELYQSNLYRKMAPVLGMDASSCPRTGTGGWVKQAHELGFGGFVYRLKICVSETMQFDDLPRFEQLNNRDHHWDPPYSRTGHL
jgi:hypothetical protein